MNRISHIADRAALVSLKLLAALNVLVFLCALCVALAATSRIHAAESSSAFTAVGALPLSGQNGLTETVRRRGHTVRHIG